MIRNLWEIVISRFKRTPSGKTSDDNLFAVEPIKIVTKLLTPEGIETFGKGLAAWEKGGFLEAFNLWESPAQQGNAGAQFGLGLLYDRGQGIAQDYSIAVKWYSLTLPPTSIQF